MRAPYTDTGPHIAASLRESQASASERRRFWSAFGITAIALLIALAWWVHAPNQDQFASIPMNGDGSWFFDYELGREMQDPEILYDGIGHSIENAQQADIIFIGWSRLLFGLDWRVVDQFAQQHHLKIFNLGIASVYSGDFYLRIIQKWHLHPKLWVINTDRDLKDFHSGFFYMTLDNGPGPDMLERVIRHGWLTSYKNVIGRNIRWRAELSLGLLRPFQYRSASNGNWALDTWPNYRSDKNPPIALKSFAVVNGVLVASDRASDPACPALPEEVTSAKDYIREIGGAVTLIQMPSEFACAQRVHEIAHAVGVSAFTVDPTQFSSVDGGGHLDGIGAHKWSTRFFAWLAQSPEFQHAFPNGAK